MVRSPKKLFDKTIKRISESKWTKLFILTSILQAVLVITFEGRVYAHNNSERQILETMGLCKPESSITRLSNIMRENLVFMGFQAFQFLFCVNAIYNQNTIQMITIAVINYSCALFGIGQIFETVKWRRSLDEELVKLGCSPIKESQRSGKIESTKAAITSFELPLVAILLIFGTALGFLAFKLYQQFGWNIYKRIGADLRMQSVYRTMLIFVMLLKLDIFFMLAFSILALVVLDKESAKLPRGPYYFHLGLTSLIVILQALAYISLRKEWLSGMIIFISFCIISIVDYIILLKYSIASNVQDTWFFWIFFIILSCIITGLTGIWASLVTRNFGHGLKVFLDKGKHDEHPIDEHDMGQVQVPPRRWAIEDEDE
ncbi:hypothetical protein G9A89_014216 [Geosiphon pyriformis]|nr:hypothetical protein G9A89_014216 [Geosiphon pyriformis]